MKVGFSLSPGGLLLPYHLGVLDALEYRGWITDDTPLAGASAGAIATVSKAAKINSLRVLDSTIGICDECYATGGRRGSVRGRLMPLLKQSLATHVGAEQFHTLQHRPGTVAVSYAEIFPKRKDVVQTQFRDRFDVIRAVCQSSMFPFFTSNWPAILDTSGEHPKLIVDGVFTVPFERVGCPDFDMAGVDVDRTVRISVIPLALMGCDDNSRGSTICPRWEGGYQLGRLFRLATEGSSRPELTALYESGWSDAEKWCRREMSDRAGMLSYALN